MTETFTFYNTQSESPYQLQLDVINTLVVDADDHVWLGTAGEGLEVLSPKEGIVALYNLSDGVSGMNSDWITHLYQDSFNRIWVGSWKGALTLIDQKTNQVRSWSASYFDLDIPHFSPFSLVENEKGDFWLGLWEGGLVHLTLLGDSLAVRQHLMPPSSGLISDVIYDLIIDHNENLWVGTPFGLDLMTDPDSRQPGYRLFKNAPGIHQISHDEAYTLLCDASGLIWVGTSGGGVNILDDKVQLFSPLSLPEVSPNFQSQSVTAFTKAPNNDLLIGVRSLGFGRYHVDNQSFVQYTSLPEYDGLPADINTVNCFYWDGSDHLWLGTRYMGLIKYDPASGRSVVINKDVSEYDFAAREISVIHPDHLGNLWVGTENGLYKMVQYDPNNFLGFNILHYEHMADNPKSLSSNRISAILQDHNDTLWIATYDHGINKLVSDIRTHFPLVFERISASDKARNGLITDNINTLFEDRDHHLWIGSGGGGLFKRANSDHHFVSYDPTYREISSTIYNRMQQGICG
ncbi:ligand-binding sensor domain-containing protein [Geofilum rubicundum]|uniref:Two-component system sensor histidine kinase/response regulator, hybrid n=1 Tax=Geofilum rubicundum JCM 15548 TaxID=1236989 RepID=A0A0E9LSE1_9BACT|nr:two-component regulator propeller domain-containing protein [Geofilum rubicundum]GAO28061.1 two-component system sensor histidine kinase/response regulator, hybrid [Geofilum rubicundum JCM 15548]